MIYYLTNFLYHLQKSIKTKYFFFFLGSSHLSMFVHFIIKKCGKRKKSTKLKRLTSFGRFEEIIHVSLIFIETFFFLGTGLKSGKFQVYNNIKNHLKRYSLASTMRQGSRIYKGYLGNNRWNTETESKDSKEKVYEKLTKNKVIYLELMHNQRQKILLELCNFSFQSLTYLFIHGNQIKSIESINLLFAPEIKHLCIKTNLIVHTKTTSKLVFRNLRQLDISENLCLGINPFSKAHLPKLNKLRTPNSIIEIQQMIKLPSKFLSSIDLGKSDIHKKNGKNLNKKWRAMRIK